MSSICKNKYFSHFAILAILPCSDGLSIDTNPAEHQRPRQVTESARESDMRQGIPLPHPDDQTAVRERHAYQLPGKQPAGFSLAALGIYGIIGTRTPEGVA